MKKLLPWFLVVAFAAAAGAMFVSGRTREAELSKLRDESAKFQAERTEADQNKNLLAAQEETIKNLRKEVQELPRLRNQVGQMQTERQKLLKDLETAKSEAARSATQASQALQNAQNLTQRVAAQQSEALRTTQLNTCINNLRQIDGAKQQWALERNKTADAIPTLQDLLPYFRDHLMPACPAGGVYTLNNLSTPPACSIPGHALSN